MAHFPLPQRAGQPKTTGAECQITSSGGTTKKVTDGIACYAEFSLYYISLRFFHDNSALLLQHLAAPAEECLALLYSGVLYKYPFAMKNEENFRQFVELRLGISDMEIELLARSDTLHATDLMLGQTQATLEIFSRELDPELYDRQDFLDAVKQLCLRNRKARIRVLVQDPQPAVKRSHRLIELSHRLSSSIDIRRPNQDYNRYNEAFMIADECGLVHFPLADQFEGTSNFYNPVEARRKLDFFNEVWERSESQTEFRRLHI